MTTWNELTADERACLFNIATSDKAVDGWIWRSALDSLIAHGLIEERISPHRICYVKITPTGFTVYQQGQTPAEPAKPDELTRLREQVAALTAERDALVQAGNAVLDEVTVNKRGFISVAIGATVHSWNKSTGMGRALFALREVLIASAKKRTGNE